MTNANKILLGTTIVLVLILGALLFKQNLINDDNYYAVMLVSGDVFFGKLHTFPHAYLTNVWTLQRNPNDTKTPLNLVKFDQSFWGPGDRIDFSDKEIIWEAKLAPGSKVLAQIKSGAVPLQESPQGAPVPAPATK